MMSGIKENLIYMVLGLCLMAFGVITALSLSDDFWMNHSFIGSITLSPFIMFGCVLATTNSFILVIQLVLRLLNMESIKSNKKWSW
ncbi:hypothetical protein LA99_19130 [Salmonella enterica]|nr:hypothetical protein [Salmonella enterica]EBP0680252.1 hypothetical protein [Salmonella enterica]EDV9342326.1 hypothetical protein [Salmonella enterica subsp. enterica]